MTGTEDQARRGTPPFETAEFFIPSLDGGSGAVDLANALTTLNGVVHVGIDREAHRVSIEYDPDFSTPSAIKSNILAAGYPIDGSGDEG